MKRLFLSLCVMFFVCFQAESQILKPVTWAYAAKKTSANTATIYIKATLEDGWHLYSQYVKDGGPVATKFQYTDNRTYTLIAPTSEPKAVSKYEEAFKTTVSYFEKSVVFQQKIRFNGKTPVVKGKVEFMVCNDKQCLPPEEIEFSVAVK